MTANSRGLPLSGTRLASLGPEWGGIGPFAPWVSNDDRVQNTEAPAIWDATWQSNIYVWVLHDCQLTWPAFDRKAVDRVGPPSYSAPRRAAFPRQLLNASDSGPWGGV